MIRADVEIRPFKWRVKCFFAVDRYYSKEILNELFVMGCPYELLDKARKNLTSGHLDSGLCYSDPANRQSVLVTSLTSSAEEFVNSFCHEVTHLAIAIAREDGINYESEDFCYIAGGIARALSRHCMPLFCDECREKLD